MKKQENWSFLIEKHVLLCLFHVFDQKWKINIAKHVFQYFLIEKHVLPCLFYVFREKTCSDTFGEHMFTTPDQTERSDAFGRWPDAGPTLARCWPDAGPMLARRWPDAIFPPTRRDARFFSFYLKERSLNRSKHSFCLKTSHEHENLRKLIIFDWKTCFAMFILRFWSK